MGAADNGPGIRAHLACGFKATGTVPCFRKSLVAANGEGDATTKDQEVPRGEAS